MMNQDKSRSEYSQESRRYPLASRLKRFQAALLDNLLGFIILYPILSYHGWLVSLADYTVPVSYSTIVLMAIYSFIIFLLVNSYHLYKYGQTLGKRVVGIAVATENQQVMEFNRLVALRYLPFRIVGVIPYLSLIQVIDILYIFRADKRCLHDMLAKTCVIDIGIQSRPRPD